MKLRFVLCFFCLYLPFLLLAQTPATSWKSLWVGTEENWWTEEDEEFFSDLVEHPLNVYELNKETLSRFPFLSDTQIEHILYYIYKYSPLHSIEELQAVEDMDRSTWELLRCFLYVGTYEKQTVSPSLPQLLKYGTGLYTARVDIPLFTKAGYLPSVYQTEKGYMGTATYLNTRFRWRCKDRLQIGLQAEKDAGEAFFTPYNRNGFDHYTGYLFMSGKKHWETIGIGHYKVAFGKGLVINNGFLRSKDPFSPQMDRQGAGISPNTSIVEDAYLQGIGATYKWKQWKICGFLSYKQESGRQEEGIITHWKKDGLYRTQQERKQKNSFSQGIVGGNISYENTRFGAGITAVVHHLNYPLSPPIRYYNKDVARGDKFANVGLHYTYKFPRAVLSGECAFNAQGRMAWLQTYTYRLYALHTLRFIARYYDVGYTAIYGQGYGEATDLQNEWGLTVAWENKNDARFHYRLYADVFHFPQVRYGIRHKHTWGGSWTVAMRYAPRTSWWWEGVYSGKNKARDNVEDGKLVAVLPHIRHKILLRSRYKFSSACYAQGTLQYIYATTIGKASSSGWGGSIEAGYAPTKLPLRFQVMGTLFHTADYESRFSLYEPSLRYMYGFGMYQGTGYKGIALLQWDIYEKLRLQAHLSYTHYTDRHRIGQGREQIEGNKKADFRLQLLWKF